MPGPWEKYAKQPDATPSPGGPWEKYAQPSDPARPAGPPAGVDLPGLPGPDAPINMDNQPGVARAAAIKAHPFTGGFDFDTRTVPSDGSETGGSKLAAHVQNVLGPAAATMFAPVRHPIDTAKGIGGFVVNHLDPTGTAARTIGLPTPAEMSPVRNIGQDADRNGLTAAAEHLGGQVAGAYLGGEALKPTLQVGGEMLSRLPSAGGLKVLMATPESQKLAATRLLVPGSTGEVLNRALKPGSRYGNSAQTAQMFTDVIPTVSQTGLPMGSVSEFGAATDAAANANNAAYQSRVNAYRPVQSGAQGTALPSGSVVNGADVARAQVDSVPFIKAFEDPSIPNPPRQGDGFWAGQRRPNPEPYKGIVQRMAETAEPYRRALDVPTADTLRGGANQQLHAFYEKAGGDQYGALANPETARVKAVGDSIRDQLYPILDTDFGLEPGTTSAQQEMYGKLKNVGDISNNRSAVAGRHDPVSLPEKIVSGHGGPLDRIGNFLANRAIRSVTDSDALVRSAVDRFNNPSSTPLMLRPGIAMPNPAAKALFFAPVVQPPRR